MIDLSTTYLGFRLRNPLVVSASPLSEEVDNLRRMEEAGAAAIVLPSLFEEQILLESQDLDHYLSFGAESFAEALTYLPELPRYHLGPERYLEHIRRAKEAVGIPIFASLNGTSEGGWIRYARRIEEAGADALELNIYHIPTDPNLSGGEVEQTYVDLVRAVREQVRIPLAVKLVPFFSAPANMARRLKEAGADALVLFNRFYEPDFDLEQLEVVPRLTLSTSQELLLRLHWVAILYGRVEIDLAVTGGVHTAEDVLKAMMAGAKVAMMTSALLRNGIEYLRRMLEGLRAWMEEREYESIEQMQGSMSYRAVADPEAFERVNYLKVIRPRALREHSR